MKNTYLNDYRLINDPFVTGTMLPFNRSCIQDLGVSLYYASGTTESIGVVITSLVITQTTAEATLALTYPGTTATTYLGILATTEGSTYATLKNTTSGITVCAWMQTGLLKDSIGMYTGYFKIAPSHITVIPAFCNSTFSSMLINDERIEVPENMELNFTGYLSSTHSVETVSGSSIDKFVISATVPATAITTVQDELSNYSMVKSINGISFTPSNAQTLALTIATSVYGAAGTDSSNYVDYFLDNAIRVSQISTAAANPDTAVSTDGKRTTYWSNLNDTDGDAVILTIRAKAKCKSCYGGNDEANAADPVADPEN